MIDFILNNICLLGIIHFVGRNLLIYKNSKSKSVFIFIFFVLMINLVNINSLSLPMVMGLMFFIYFYLILQYKSNYINSLIITVFLLLNILLSSMIGRMLFIDISIPYYLLMIGLNILLSFLLVYFLKHIFKVSLPTFSILLIFFPLFSILHVLYIGYEFNYYSKRNIVVLILLGIFVSNYISLYFFSIAAKGFQLKINWQKQLHKEELLDLRFNLLEMNFKNNFNLLHKFLHIGIKLNNLMDQGKIEDAKLEIINMTNNLFEEFNSLYSNSLSLNTVLEQYKEKLNEKKIKVRSTIITETIDSLTFNEQYQIFDFLVFKAIHDMDNDDPNIKKFIYISANNQNNKMIYKIVYPLKEKNENMTNFTLRKHKTNVLQQYDRNTNTLLLIVDLDESFHIKKKL